MAAQMRAAVLHEAGRLVLERAPVPDIGPQDVLVRVGYVGICGSDMALFENGFIGDSVMTAPMVLGHEASGTVAAVGEQVTSLAVGDRVAMEPGVPCWRCDLCRRGHYNLCPEVHFWASLPVREGALQEYVRHPASQCFRLPASVDLVEGALIEPLAVGLHAVLGSGLRLGDTAAVLGAGGVGLLTMLCLEAAGAQAVVVSDLHDRRLEKAASMGGSRVRVIRADEEFPSLGEGAEMGPDVVFETAGSASAMNRAIELVRPGGTLALVGYTHDGRAELDVNLLIDKEVRVTTSFRYRHVYRKAIMGVASGMLPVGAVVSDVFPLADVQRGMEKAVWDKRSTTKCVVSVAPDAPETGR